MNPKEFKLERALKAYEDSLSLFRNFSPASVPPAMSMFGSNSNTRRYTSAGFRINSGEVSDLEVSEGY